MASFFCSSTGIPGLLGQLILSTVATQAALNSLTALGFLPEGSPVATGLVVKHFVKIITKETEMTVSNLFFSMVSV